MAERKKRAPAGTRKHRSPSLHGSGKLARSETVTARLDPKIRYLADLAARKQRRTLSSFFEWAIERAMSDVHLGSEATEPRLSVAEDAINLWDVDEPDRFVKLAFRYPELLTHDEQVLWKLIREDTFVWTPQLSSSGGKNKWSWDPHEDGLLLEQLRQRWEKIKAVARGEVDRSVLGE